MKKKWLMIVLAVVLALGCVGVGAWAATNAGTQSDPLVSMSYIEDVLAPRLQREFDNALDDAVNGLGETNGEFKSVDLNAGSVSLSVGAEVICLKSGAAATGTLIDVTAGGVANSGDALAVNHLYIVADTSVVLSGEGEALVRAAGVGE